MEAIIRKSRAAGSRARVKRVTRPSAGGGLQRVGAPKRDEDGTQLSTRTAMESGRRSWRPRRSAVRRWREARSTSTKRVAAPFAAGSEDAVLCDLIGYGRGEQSSQGRSRGRLLEKCGDDLGALRELSR